MGSCDFCNILGRTPLTINSNEDPLATVLTGSSYNMGGNKWMTALNKAVRCFVDREYPNDTLMKPGLTVIPDLPVLDTRHIFSAQGRMGGLLSDENEKDGENEGNDSIAAILNSPDIDPEKKKLIKSLKTKFRGENGEEQVLIPLIKKMAMETTTTNCLIHSHKTGSTILEHCFRGVIDQDPEAPTDKYELEAMVVCKIAQTIGIEMNISEIEQNIEKTYQYHLNKKYTEQEITVKIEAELQTVNLPKYEREKRSKDMETLSKMLEEDEDAEYFNPFGCLKLAHMRRQVNQNLNEHDIIAVFKEQKTIIQFEIKSTETNATVNAKVKETQNAINQLRGGKEEFERIHGFLLDDDWTYIGVVSLPNLNNNDKQQIKNRKSICENCIKYVMVEDMDQGIAELFNLEFKPGSEFTVDLNQSYISLIERLAAYIHLAPSHSMEQITGESSDVQGGYSKKKDVLPQFDTCPVSHLKEWKEAKHTGSSSSILFMNKHQLSLWGDRRLVFIADFGVGKTTLLKSKAMSLANAGEKVLFVFLGSVDNSGKPAAFENVMDVLNKTKLVHENESIECVSAQDLQKFYFERNRNWTAKFWTPHVLETLKFYLQEKNVQNTQNNLHVLVDEAPMTRNMLVMGFETALDFSFNFFLNFSNLNLNRFFIVMFIVYTVMISSIPYPNFGAIGVIGVILLLKGRGSISPRESKNTANILHSCSTLLPATSTLWVAFHTEIFRGNIIPNGSVTDKTLNKLVEKLSLSATSHTRQEFTIAGLHHNMRNTAEICKATESHSRNRMHQSKCAAPPPHLPAPNTTTREKKAQYLPLPWSSYTDKLPHAVVYAYRKLLNVPHEAEDRTSVIILVDDHHHIDMISTCLQQDGVPPDNIIKYQGDADRQHLKQFLLQPCGLLITTDVAFSGMEARNVIVCNKFRYRHFTSARLRAIERLVVISGDEISGDEIIDDMTDVNFLTCPARWGTSLYNCVSCGMTRICYKCAIDCHRVEGCTQIEHSFRATLINVFLPFTKCQCECQNNAESYNIVTLEDGE